MLHITLKDIKRNTWRRARTRVTYTRERATRLKWQYAGQVDSRWNAQILNWRPWLGKRERRRPQMRWEDDIKRRAGLTWRRQVQNRDTWKESGETYIRKGIEEVWEEEKKKKKKNITLHHHFVHDVNSKFANGDMMTWHLEIVVSVGKLISRPTSSSINFAASPLLRRTGPEESSINRRHSISDCRETCASSRSSGVESNLNAAWQTAPPFESRCLLQEFPAGTYLRGGAASVITITARPR